MNENGIELGAQKWLQIIFLRHLRSPQLHNWRFLDRMPDHLRDSG